MPDIFDAAKERNLDLLIEYLDKGVDINIKNKKNESLLDVALENIHNDWLSSKIGDNDINLEKDNDFILFLINKGINISHKFSCPDLIEDASIAHVLFRLELYRATSDLITNKHINGLETANDATTDGWFGVTFYGKPRFSNNVLTYRQFTQAYFLEKATLFHYACITGNRDIVILLHNVFGSPLLSAKANLILNKKLADVDDAPDITNIDLEDISSETESETSSEEPGVEELGWGWAMRDTWPIRRIKWVTPLHLAARIGHVDLVELLVNLGADVEAEDGEGYTPFDYARIGLEDFNDKYDSILTSYGADEVTDGATLEQVKLINDLKEKWLEREMRMFLGEYQSPEKKVDKYKSILSFLKEQMERKPKSKTKKMQLTHIVASSQIDKMAELEIKRQLIIENRFLDIGKSRSKQTLQLKNLFLENRYGESKVAQVIDVPTRRLITADAASVQLSIEKSGGSKNLRTQNAIEMNLKWKVTKRDPKYGTQYAWQEIQHADGKLIYTHKPVPGHLGGFFMPIQPSKNSYTDIFDLINVFTQNNQYHERFLARCMILYASTGQPFPRGAFRQMGIELSTQQYELLFKICYLTSVKEITRRMFTGQRPNGSDVDTLPFATAHSRALILIRDGFLRMNQVFSQDAEYGLPTGLGVTTSNYNASLQKVKRINALYEQYKVLKLGKVFEGLLTPGRELRRELLNTYGGYGDSDSEDEGYDEKSLSSLVKRG